MKKTTRHRHVVIFGLTVLGDASRTARGGLVSVACEECRAAKRDLLIWRRCKRHEAKLRHVLFALLFSPGWEQGVFVSPFVLWIFFSVFLPTD